MWHVDLHASYIITFLLICRFLCCSFYFTCHNENVPLHGLYTDDVSQPDADKAVDESGKESAFDSLGSKNHAVKETSPAPRTTTDQLAPEVAVSGTLFHTGSGQFLHDGEGIC